MTPLALATLIRTNTRTNTTTFPDSMMLPWVKVSQDELARKLMNALASDEDIFLTPQTSNLVASSTSREYGFPADMLAKVKRVEAKLDGTNWIRIMPMDMSEYKWTHDEATIINYFSNLQGEAKYDIRRRALFIYSGTIEAVVNGLKLWVFDYPAYIADLTEDGDDIEDDPSADEHGFPRELHELLARRVQIFYKESREKPIPLSQTELYYDKDTKEAIATLKNGDLNREIIGNLPPANERGNNGQDY